MSARLTTVAVVLVAPVVLGGCLGVETTQDKSARKAAQAKHAITGQTGLQVGRANPDVKVEQSLVVQDSNGVAAVVRVRNTGATQVRLPVAISVADAKGRRLYANDIPGLDPSLVSLPVLEKGQEAYWVNNQILTSGKAKQLQVRVGTGKGDAPARLPRIALSKIALGRDTDGVYAKGVVRNESSILQRRLTITCVARAGRRVLAAGRAVIDKLPPAAESRKPTNFTVFFIGDPKGARLECDAPPTVLSEGAAK